VVCGPFINKTLVFAFQRVCLTHSSRAKCLSKRGVVLPLETLEELFLILFSSKAFLRTDERFSYGNTHYVTNSFLYGIKTAVP
jgi:hypothetical protein